VIAEKDWAFNMNRKKNALITGSAQGIGAGIARSFALAGYHVIIADTSTSPAHRSVEELRNEGFTATALEIDVTDVVNLQKAMYQIDKELPLDCVVANAGVAHEIAFENVSETDFDAVYSVNVRGAFFTLQAGFRCMSARGSGSLIAIASTSSFTASTGHMTVYDSSKGAVRSMIGAIAKEVATSGVRVNGVAPGTVQTPLSESLASVSDLERLAQTKIPLGRLGTPAEIGSACVFLASDAAEYICGHTLVVDGGWLT
jgi:NAD(P)-dependent dehydrogenase (short-subunit alcohol dehydrogenase family)